MKKISKKSKGPAKAATKRTVAIKDLKAKDADSVKGGAIFLKLAGISGESRDDKHEHEIDVLE